MTIDLFNRFLDSDAALWLAVVSGGLLLAWVVEACVRMGGNDAD